MEADAMKKKRHIEKIHLAREEKNSHVINVMQNVTQDSICANTITRNMGNPHNMPYVTKKSLEKGNLSRKTVQELQSKSMQTSLAAKMREKNCW